MLRGVSTGLRAVTCLVLVSTRYAENEVFGIGKVIFQKFQIYDSLNNLMDIHKALDLALRDNNSERHLSGSRDSETWKKYILSLEKAAILAAGKGAGHRLPPPPSPHGHPWTGTTAADGSHCLCSCGRKVLSTECHIQAYREKANGSRRLRHFQQGVLAGKWAQPQTPATPAPFTAPRDGHHCCRREPPFPQPKREGCRSQKPPLRDPLQVF